MYTITVSRSAQGQEGAVYSPVKDYEIKDGMLTVAFDDNHDVVIPLFHVTAVDIVRHE
jgi:frataxin-like iron-binding protein CyaY